jgi:hypothetical protein
MKREDVSKATTKELVEFYNSVSEKPVKRFSTRKDAERRVLDLIPSSKLFKNNLAQAIHESWKVEETYNKRRQRSAVIVNGLEYPSIPQAFRDLNLPLNECIKFRMELKVLKKAEAYGYRWEIVPKNY